MAVSLWGNAVEPNQSSTRTILPYLVCLVFIEQGTYGLEKSDGFFYTVFGTPYLPYVRLLSCCTYEHRHRLGVNGLEFLPKGGLYHHV